MYNFKSLRCYHCHSVILNLPEVEILKLNGLNFECECCGHQNQLNEFKFDQGINLENHHSLSVLSFENF